MSVEVKQVDRELFSYLLGWDVTDHEEHILAGKFDSHVKMRKIAAHRHQSEEAMRERCLAAVSNYRAHCPFDEQMDAADKIAAAIRSIDTRGE